MTDKTQTLLQDTLRAVADHTTVATDWDRLVDDLDFAQPPVVSARHRGRVLMAAAAMALFVGGAFALAQVGGGEVSVSAGTDYVLPGETVLARDPLVVAAANGPEPMFATSDLGQELTWQPADVVTPATIGAIDLAGFAAGDEASVTKVVALGSVRNEPFTIVITDGPNESGLLNEPTSLNQRQRFVVGSDSASGGGDLVLASSLSMIEMPPSSDGTSFVNGAGYSAPSGWVTWTDLPSDTSVATFADDDSEMWIRVRSGVAVFPAEFSSGETFRLVALDAQGNELGRYSETVRF